MLGVGEESRTTAGLWAGVLVRVQHPLPESRVCLRFATLQGHTHIPSRTVWRGRHRNEGGIGEPGHGEREEQGTRSQMKDSVPGCPLAQNPVPALQLSSASVYPSHCLSARAFVHLLAKGSVPGTWTPLPSLPLGPRPPLLACPKCHASAAGAFQRACRPSPSSQRVSVFPPFAQRLNICNQPQSQ